MLGTMTIDIGGADAKVRFDAEHLPYDVETGARSGWAVEIRAVLVAGERVAADEWNRARLEADVADRLAVRS